jgi:hypothetical protein
LNIAEFFVRISADAKGVDKGVAEAETGLSRLTGIATAAGAAIAAAFTVDKLVDFGRASVASAAEAETVWNRLAGSLQNAGVQFNAVAGEIEGVVTALETTSTLGDEDVAGTLQTLVRISGDYAASLAQVRTVADLAAGAQIDLDTAAQLVGKAMIGQTDTLKRYGIVVQEGDDALALLQERFAGMAENEAKTLQGQMTQLSNAWGDFQEAIGNALVAMSGSESIIGRVTEGIRALTGWVERNSEQLRLLGEAFVSVGTFAVQQLGYILEGFNRVNSAVGTLLRWLGLLDEEVQGKLVKLGEVPPVIAAAFGAMASDVVTSMDTVASAIDSTEEVARRGAAVLDRIEADAARAAEERTKTLEEEKEKQERFYSDLADSIVDFATTGKGAMSDFVDSAVADLTRLAIRLAAMKFFEVFINPIGAAGASAASAGGAALSVGSTAILNGSAAPSVPAQSLEPSGASLSAASGDSEVAAALNARRQPQTPDAVAQDEWWVEFFARLYGISLSRGLRA